ncbi:MAG TPA: sigma-70 family RNA polymerase sigma factor [Pyrinomonadaceae bacterium]
MARRGKAIPPDSLNALLTWFDSDRDTAAGVYLQLRADLTRLFECRQCADPEGLTDEVFDRVACKVHAVKPTYIGDPKHYFRAIANNIIKEENKRPAIEVPLSFDPLAPEDDQGSEKQAADLEDCLRWCLQKLRSDKRDLVLAYYSKDKQAKIDYRHEMAEQMGIPIVTLRVRVHRIRERLRRSMLRCLQRKAESALREKHRC